MHHPFSICTFICKQDLYKTNDYIWCHTALICCQWIKYAQQYMYHNTYLLMYTLELINYPCNNHIMSMFAHHFFHDQYQALVLVFFEFNRYNIQAYSISNQTKLKLYIRTLKIRPAAEKFVYGIKRFKDKNSFTQSLRDITQIITLIGQSLISHCWKKESSNY